MSSSKTSPLILRIYPSSSGQFDWSNDSVCSASTTHSLPQNRRTANPYNPSPPSPPRPLHQADQPTPFLSGQQFNYYTFNGVPSQILGTYGARYDSKGHIIHKVQIAHPMRDPYCCLVTYELYERSPPPFLHSHLATNAATAQGFHW